MYQAPTDPALWQRWHDAAADPAVADAIAAVHQRIADAFADRQPRCDQSGRCCRFHAYGHDLYLTGLEVAAFRHRAPPPPSSSQAGAERSAASGIALPQAQHDPDRVCPYLVDNACSVHAVRPAGCRVYFCEPGTHDWQQHLYEQTLDDLRRLHDAHDLPYRYMEWLDGLNAAASAIKSYQADPLQDRGRSCDTTRH